MIIPSMRMAIAIGAGLAAASCQLPPQPQQNRAELERLQAARDCSATLPWFGWVYGGPRELHYQPADGRIAMRNDGGWCWVSTELTWERQVITPEMRVTQPPEHGSVIVGSVNAQIRIAYRPAPDYAGADSFQVRYGGPTPDNVPVRVTVVR